MMKALALFSGGLDSCLAVKLVRKKIPQITALSFSTPFSPIDGKKESLLERLAKDLEVKLRIVYIKEDYLEIIRRPRYGFGKNLNPCIDCKILMLRYAKEIMLNEGAKFIITGEVLGQRPKSQTRTALEIIEKDSGLEGLILRPLSAKLLKETLPEKEGWVERKELLGLKGRSRKFQLELAVHFSLKGYFSPAGGCLLTDPGFCQRLRDLIEHEEFTLDNVELLKIGRHFRISPYFRLIVARNFKETRKLKELFRPPDIIFRLRQFPEIIGLGRGVFNDSFQEVCCKIVSRYSPSKGKDDSLEIEILGLRNKLVEFKEKPDEDFLEALRI